MQSQLRRSFSQMAVHMQVISYRLNRFDHRRKQIIDIRRCSVPAPVLAIPASILVHHDVILRLHPHAGRQRVVAAAAAIFDDVIERRVGPRLLLARSEDGVEYDAEKVDYTGDEEDRLPFGYGLLQTGSLSQIKLGSFTRD